MTSSGPRPSSPIFWPRSRTIPLAPSDLWSLLKDPPSLTSGISLAPHTSNAGIFPSQQHPTLMEVLPVSPAGLPQFVPQSSRTKPSRTYLPTRSGSLTLIFPKPMTIIASPAGWLTMAGKSRSKQPLKRTRPPPSTAIGDSSCSAFVGTERLGAATSPQCSTTASFGLHSHGLVTRSTYRPSLRPPQLSKVSWPGSSTAATATRMSSCPTTFLLP